MYIPKEQDSFLVLFSVAAFRDPLLFSSHFLDRFAIAKLEKRTPVPVLAFGSAPVGEEESCKAMVCIVSNLIAPLVVLSSDQFRVKSRRQITYQMKVLQGLVIFGRQAIRISLPILLSNEGGGFGVAAEGPLIVVIDAVRQGHVFPPVNLVYEFHE
jgi:hypothetical protein